MTTQAEEGGNGPDNSFLRHNCCHLNNNYPRTGAMEYLSVTKPLLHDFLEPFLGILPALCVAYWTLSLFVTFNPIWKQPSLQRVPLMGEPFGLTAPKFVLNLIFAWRAEGLLQKGYRKVRLATFLYSTQKDSESFWSFGLITKCEQFRTSPFQLLRNDGPILVLPPALLEELSELPMTIANPQAALEHDLLGHFTGLNLIVENRLHHSIVQRRLTPRIPVLVPRLEQSVTAAFRDYFTESGNDWMEFQPYQVLGRIAARVAADAIVGPNLCNNQAWLELSVDYTENLFKTIVILRMFPMWMQHILYPLLPSYWQGKKNLKIAKELLSPQIRELIDKSDSGVWTPQDDNIDDINLLNWLASMAKGRDRNPEVISHVLVLVALASVHTTLLRMVNVIYDITAAGSSLKDELLDEIESVSESGWGSTKSDLPYDRLHKLDSVLLESQRMSPPTILGLKRLFRKDYTFQDGTYVSEGTYVCMPIHAIENDVKHTANPEEFDGLRAFRARQTFQDDSKGLQSKSNDSDLLFSTPTPTTLNFGYGKTACPGRFFASVVIKMVLVKMLTEYDFSFLAGKERPSNLLVHEFLFTWPWQKMMMKRKVGEFAPF